MLSLVTIMIDVGSLVLDFYTPTPNPDKINIQEVGGDLDS